MSGRLPASRWPVAGRDLTARERSVNQSVIRIVAGGDLGSAAHPASYRQRIAPAEDGNPVVGNGNSGRA
jgi:hypothetical protein